MRMAGTSSIGMEHILGEQRCVTCRMTQQDICFWFSESSSCCFPLAGGKFYFSVKLTALRVCHVGYTSTYYTMAFIAVSFGAVEECKGQVENDETSQWKVTEKIMSPLQIMICVGCTSITELSSLTELSWQSRNILHPAVKAQNVYLEG